jgi:beta-glucosidase-like glycosyl hydrolase
VFPSRGIRRRDNPETGKREGRILVDAEGATHSTIPAANAGLDQQSGYPFDVSPYFADALKEAVEDGYVTAARLDDMAARILRSMFVNGLFDDPVKTADIDFEAHAEVSRAVAEGAIVLLKNEHHLLPLGKSVKSICLTGKGQRQNDGGVGNRRPGAHAVGRQGGSRTGGWVSGLERWVVPLAQMRVYRGFLRSARLLQDQAWELRARAAP